MSRHKRFQADAFPEHGEVSDFKELCAKLRTELEMEREQTKKLRREKSVEVRQTSEQEQNRASIALKNLKLKLQQEKGHELELQKEALNKKYESDIQKVTKMKDSEIHKVKNDLQKCQIELEEVIKNRGLSGLARGAFEADHKKDSKTQQELLELKSAKKNLEEELKKVTESDRQNLYKLQRLQEQHKKEVSKVKKDGEIEIRKLIDDVKTKERKITRMQKELDTHIGHYQKFHPPPPLPSAVALPVVPQVVVPVAPPAKETPERESKEEPKQKTEKTTERPRSMERSLIPRLVQTSVSCSHLPDSNECGSPPKDIETVEETNYAQKIKELEDLCAKLSQEKQDLQTRVKDNDKKFKLMVEKNKKYLEKNVEITKINREVEDSMKKLQLENSKLKSQIEKSKKDIQHLNEQLKTKEGNLEQQAAISEELEELKQTIAEQDKTVMALNLACAEKDRRIELITYRKRNQQVNKSQQKPKVVRFMLPAKLHFMAAGLKETCYGCDEDYGSVGSDSSSNMSATRMSVGTSLGEDEVFDEISKEELQKNFQILTKEHLELEKAFAVLQSKYPSTDPEQHISSQEINWKKEREEMNKILRELRAEIKEQEQKEVTLAIKLHDSEEQNEELEFRLLELQEANEKMAEDAKHTITFKEPAELSDARVLQMFVEEQGAIEISLSVLKEKLIEMKYKQDQHLSRDEKILLIQARATVDIADRKLRELQNNQLALRTRICSLEKEKAEAIAEVTDVSEDLVLEYESTRNKLIQAELKNEQLNEEVSELKKAEAIYKYTEDFNLKTEERYKQEIAYLKRQISISVEGRDYENEIIFGKVDKIKEKEAKITELEHQVKVLEKEVADLQTENGLLQEQISLQETQSMTEVDKETSSLLNKQRGESNQQEKSESTMDQNQNLETEVTTLKVRLAEFEKNESKLLESKKELEEKVEEVTKKCQCLQEDLDHAHHRLKQSKSHHVSDDEEGESVINKAAFEADLSIDNQRLRSESFTLKEQLADREMQLEKLKGNIGQDMHEKCRNLEKVIDDLTHENTILKQKIKDFSSELQNKEDTILLLQEHNDALETKVIEMKEENEELQKKAKKKTNNLQSQKEANKWKEQVDIMLEEERALRDQIKELLTAKSLLAASLDKITNKQKVELEDLHEKINVLELKDTAAIKTIRELEQDNKHLQDRVQELEALGQIKDEIRELEKTRSTLQAKEVLLQSLKGDVNAEKQKSQQEQKLTLHNDLSEKEKRIQFLEQQLKLMSDSQSKLKETCSELEILEETCKKQLGELERSGEIIKSQEIEIEKLKSKEQPNKSKMDSDEEEHNEMLSNYATLLESSGEIHSEHSEEDNRLEKTTGSEGTSLHDTQNVSIGCQTDSEGQSEEEEDEYEVDSEEDDLVNSKEFGKTLAFGTAIKEIESDEPEDDDGQVAEVKITDGATPSGGKDNKYKKKIAELKQRVDELTTRETELMEDIYSIKIEQQELKEHNEELMDQIEELENQQGHDSSDGSPRSPRHSQVKSEVIDELKGKIAELKKDNNDLKDELLKAKLSSIETLKETKDFSEVNSATEMTERIKELEKNDIELKQKLKNMEMLEKKLSKLEEAETRVQMELLEKCDKEAALLEKIDLLEESEGKLMDQIDVLEEQVETLEKKSMKVEKSGDTSVSDSGYIEKIHHLEEELETVKSQKAVLVETLKHTSQDSDATECEQLKEKLDILLDSEEKLMDRIQEQEGVEQELINKINRYEEAFENYEAKIQQLEEREAKAIKETVSTDSGTEMEEKNLEIKALQQSRSELESQNLVYKYQVGDLEAAQRSLKQSLDEVTMKKEALEIQVEHLQYKGAIDSHDRIENAEKELRKKLAALEKEKALLEAKVVGYKATIEELQNSNAALHEKGSTECKQVTTLQQRVRELETSVRDLETNNTELANTLHIVQDSHLTPGDATSLDISDSMIELDSFNEGIEKQTAHGVYTSTGIQLASQLLKVTTQDWSLGRSLDVSVVTESHQATDVSVLQTMGKEELVSRVHELEQMEIYHKAKIAELNENLTLFREAVEVATVSLETDADMPMANFRPRTKETEFEARVQELVKSEITMKMKVLQLEKKQRLLKSQLNQSQDELNEVEGDYKSEIEELEAQIKDLQKSEARLKNKLQYGSSSDGSNALAKIQHLEDLVFELEAAENKLKRRVQELERTSAILRQKLEAAEACNHVPLSSVLAELEEKDKYLEVLKEVKVLESSEKELKDQLARLEKSDTAELQARISDLERTKRGLERKIEFLEAQELKSSITSGEIMLDTPEAILRQRIRELEKMELHLKTQIVDLEKDREELHDIARKDKNVIHELNVKVRELQLSEKNLKDQLNRIEIEENHLQNKVDDMTDRIEELEDALKKTRNVERHLKAQLSKYQFQEDDLNTQLENTKEDFQVVEQRWKRKISEMEAEKNSMSAKIDELTDRIGDLEGVELNLKGKLRTFENSDFSLQEKVKSLEVAETSAKSRTAELEALNESMFVKIQKLEEEKSHLRYEVSDLELCKEESTREINKLKENLKHMKERLENRMGSDDTLTKHLEELTEKDLRQTSTINELKEKCAKHEENERRLRSNFLQLEARVATEHIRDSCGHEIEMDEMKKELYNYNVVVQEREGLQRALASTKKAYELLKSNNEDLKDEHRQLRQKIKDGKVTLKETPVTPPKRVSATTTKAVQAKFGDTFTIKQITPELKKALKELGARHPDAYDQFVLNLQPHTVQKSVIPVIQSSPQKTQSDNTERVESHITPFSTGRQAAPPSGNDKGDPTPPRPRPIDVASERERDRLINDLVDTLPSGGASRGEDQFWKTVEGKGPQGQRAVNEENIWASVEKNMGETDDFTVSFTFKEEENFSDSSELRSNSEAPPLPQSLPPPRPFTTPRSPINNQFLLSPKPTPGDDSGDDASEIEDDFPYESSYPRGQRAKSADRDSVLSESLLSLGGSPNVKRKGKLGRLTGSLDSIPDSGTGTYLESDTSQNNNIMVLKNQINELEKTIKSKDKELEIARANLKEFNREPSYAEEVAALNEKIKEQEKQISTQDKENVNLQELVSTLKKQLDAKGDELKKLHEEIEKLQKASKEKNVKGSEPKTKDSGSNSSYLKSQLEKKTKEFTAKANEVDRLSKELRKWQEDSRNAKDDKIKAEKALKKAEKELEDYKENNKKNQDIQKSLKDLEQQNKDLFDKQEHFEKVSEDKAALEKIVLKLKAQLDDFERIEKEREDKQAKLAAAEQKLKDKTKSEDELVRENVTLRQQVDILERDNKEFHVMEDDYQNIRSKFDEMAKVRSKAMNMVTPLRAKVIRLSKKCRDKDVLISRMSNEMRHLGEPSELVELADRETREGASEEYNRPISPLTTSAEAFEDLELPSEATDISSYQRNQKTSKIPKRVLNHSLNGEPDHILSPRGGDEIDQLLQRAAGNGMDHSEMTQGTGDLRKQSRSEGSGKSSHSYSSYQDLNMSPPQLAFQPVTQLELESLNQTPERVSTESNGRVQPLPTANGGTFRAVKDYSPEHFSRSGHKRLELSLKEGDMIHLLGPVDEKGYHEAECNGKIGLVPALYLEPVKVSPIKNGVSSRSKQRELTGNHQDSSPEQILAMHEQLRLSHVPNHNVPSPPAISDRQSSNFNGPTSPRLTIHHPAYLRLSGSPNVSPRSGGQNAIHPAYRGLASPGSSSHPLNGMSSIRKLPNLSLAVNQGPVSPTLQSPPPTEMNLSRSTPVVTGPPDPPTEFRIYRLLGNHSVLLGWVPPELDELARSNGVVVKGYKIYINNRDTQLVPSPHLTKALIERINLQKPTHFSIQTIAEKGVASRMVDVLFEDGMLEPGGSTIDQESIGDVSSVMSSTQQEDGERRVFLAVYDYCPSEHSPNDFPSNELSFKTGDIITTCGSPRSDGFYHGKVHGKRGLVPASFIEEIAVFKSRGKRSVSNSSLTSPRYQSSIASSHMSGEGSQGHSRSHQKSGSKMAAAQV